MSNVSVWRLSYIFRTADRCIGWASGFDPIGYCVHVRGISPSRIFNELLIQGGSDLGGRRGSVAHPHILLRGHAAHFFPCDGLTVDGKADRCWQVE
jgi:hypothetical protein